MTYEDFELGKLVFIHPEDIYCNYHPNFKNKVGELVECDWVNSTFEVHFPELGISMVLFPKRLITAEEYINLYVNLK